MKKNNYPFSGVLVRIEKDDHISDAQDYKIDDGDHSEKKPNSSDAQYGNELHVNLWDFESEAILDIGVMLHKEELAAKLHIDIPWHIQKKNIIDIASKIDGERILKAVFNRDVGYVSETFVNPKIIFPDEQRKNFFLLRLNNNNFELDHSQLPSGSKVSTIKIKLPDSVKEDFEKYQKLCDSGTAGQPINRVYLRFRLADVPKEVFSTVFTQKDRNLLSSCVESTVYDCRLNTKRGIPEEVVSPAATVLHFPSFKQIHFFLVVHRDREPTFQSHSFKACRSLEDEGVWNDYIRLDGESSNHHVENVKNYLGYQWSEGKKDSEAKELLALARFNRVFSGEWIILRFVLIALLLGASSNGVWELIKYAINKCPEYSNNELNILIIGIFGAILIASLIHAIPSGFYAKVSKGLRWLISKVCCRFCSRKN